jgi:hypothetical protein
VTLSSLHAIRSPRPAAVDRRGAPGKLHHPRRDRAGALAYF